MNVNITKTKEYYNSIEDSALCDCGYCRNYRLQVKSAFPNVAVYLDSLGIDIEKLLKHHHMNPMKMECWNTAVVSILYLETVSQNIIIELMILNFVLQRHIQAQVSSRSISL